MELWMLCLLIGAVIVLNVICIIVELAKDIVWICMTLKPKRRKRGKKEGTVIGFLVCDEALYLAKVLCELLNVNPEEQKELFCKLAHACREALERYDKKSQRLNSRVNPGDK
jgi:hypothetical protein